MIIETERLILREWTEQDTNRLIDGLNWFDTAKNLTVPFPYIESDAKEFLDRCKVNGNGSYHFAITLKETGEVIGGTSITVKENSNNGGIWLHRDCVHRGYGTEAWAARARFGFEILGLNEICSGFFYFNEISKKMQLKVGYKIVGEKQNYSPALKSEVKEIRTLLTKSDFEAKQFSKGLFLVKE